MSSKETAIITVTKLVERFDEQYLSYKNQSYNETLTRRDFIDPFFKALGWDMDNENGYAEAYREVIHEDRLKISGYMKAPDYSFRLVGGKRLFFVEAKKPSIFVKGEILPAYQVRRYGWSAKLPISIITDFEEFSIYDCTKKPDPNDSASVARINYFTFKEYVKEFDFIWDTFSKEKVLKGSFDKFIQENKGKKGTATVDKEFLLSLDKWRTVLAKATSKDNKNLNEDEINFAVQQFIDRIIFLRIAEDRSVEPYGSLKETISKDNDTYKNLFKLFRTADEKYNSGIFDFKKDRISESLNIDDKVIKTIINELYYPESPYEFSVLSVEILGSAYEQFLGKQIRVSDSHRVTIEDKPEVRKAGGVYYTPQYIVEYIVNNTVSKLIENKSPKDISKIKIVDPACGSGSFLLGAYQYLLDYHKDYYSQNGKIKSSDKNTTLTPEGNLTTSEKKRILTNNIFGVDIDTNAVEVTKLSLLLKCMEGETDASIATQTKIWNERVLPNIDNNIKSGNSLIDTDFYDGEIDFGDEKKVKPFNWQKAFPEVFAEGGFDAVIGNPPWGADFDEDSLNYLKVKNREIIVRMIDSFMYFVFRSYSLLKNTGSFGMILPDVLLYQIDNKSLRKYIISNNSIKIILNMGNVFDEVNRPSSILIFSNISPVRSNKIITNDLSRLKKEDKKKELQNPKNYESVYQIELLEIPNYLFVTKNAKHYLLSNKIKQGKVKILSEFVDEDGIQRGVSPDLKEAFLVTAQQATQYKLEKKYLKNVLTGGRHVKRFHIFYPDLLLIYTNKDTKFKSIPNICNYINQFKSHITCKEVKQNKHSIYSLHRARNEKIFIKPEKLVGVITEDEIIISLDCRETYATDGLYLFGVENVNSKYLMGILNSKLFVFLYRLISMESGRALAQVKPTIISEMPIRVIDEINNQDKSLHDEIVLKVEQLISLNQEKQNTKLQSKIEQIQSRIDYCEDKINQAVYELYGLTEEEIGIVEGK